MNKTLITLIMLICVIATGLASYRFFSHDEYDASWLLTIMSYFSIVLGVYLLSNKKPALQ